MAKAKTNAVAAVRAATAELAESLDSIRQRIADLNDERGQVENAAVPKETALARLDDWAERARAGGIEGLPIYNFTQPAGDGRLEFTAMSPVHHEVVLSAIADILHDALAVRLKEVYADQAGLADDDRGQQLHKIDSELGDLELAEESIIREAELSGIPLLRRGDARPEIVLADDEAMPK